MAALDATPLADDEAVGARLGAIAPLAAALASFLLYVATLSPGVLGGDAGELQFVPPILGLTHPTGYPFQILVHKLASFVPLGSVAYRLNLLDAAIAAATVGLIAALGWRLTRSAAPALLAAAAFALGELWWSQAIRGDKYTLNALFLASVLLLFVRWRAEPEPGTLRALALVYGLSLTHHRSMLLLLPALSVGLALEGWRPRDRREPLVLLGLGLLPLVLYLYVPWAGSRGLPPGSWPVDTLVAFLEYILDRGYTSQIRLDPAVAGRLIEEARTLLRTFGPLGALVGALGAAWSIRSDWRLGSVLGLVFLPQAVLAASYLLESNYSLPRHWVFYLPAFLVWSLWVAVGLGACFRLLERSVGRPLAVAALSVAFMLVQTATVWARSAEAVVRAQTGAETLDAYRQDLQRTPVAERFGRLALDAAGPNAIVVCDWEQATVLWYLQRVEGIRPDVTVRYPIETLDETLAATGRGDRPIYVARAVPDLLARGTPSSVGPLLQVRPEPASIPSPAATPVDARLEGGLSLAGVTYHTADPRVGGVLPVTLHWRTEHPLEKDLAISVRLVSAGATEPVAQHDERHPALGTSPTTRWRPGDVIGDYHELPLGNRLLPGLYQLAVVVYEPEPLRNLARLDAAGSRSADFVALPPFEVRARPAGPLDTLLRLRG